MNAQKRAAALSLDAKLERVLGLSARIDDATTLAENTHAEIHQFILKLIQKLETERTRLDTEWNLPKAKLPFSTFADNWIENLERLVSAIESGTPISAENIRALAARRVGALRNVTEKSVVAEQLLYAPDFSWFARRTINYTSDFVHLGSEGDEEIIYAILDKLFSENAAGRLPENYVVIAFTQIICGAIVGNHRALFLKLLNDDRFTPDNLQMTSLIRHAQTYDIDTKYILLKSLIQHPKCRLSGLSQLEIDGLVGSNMFRGGTRRQRRHQRKSLKTTRKLNADMKKVGKDVLEYYVETGYDPTALLFPVASLTKKPMVLWRGSTDFYPFPRRLVSTSSDIASATNFCKFDAKGSCHIMKILLPSKFPIVDVASVLHDSYLHSGEKEILLLPIQYVGNTRKDLQFKELESFTSPRDSHPILDEVFAGLVIHVKNNIRELGINIGDDIFTNVMRDEWSPHAKHEIKRCRNIVKKRAFTVHIVRPQYV